MCFLKNQDTEKQNQDTEKKKSRYCHSYQILKFRSYPYL